MDNIKDSPESTQGMETNPYGFDYSGLRTYSGFYRNVDTLHKSASGGAASALAEAVIRAGGVVFGAVYAEDFKSARYDCAETEEDLIKQKSSKYIVTDKKIRVGNEEISLYDALAEKLKSGKKVLFTGLGCDVGAVVKYCENHQLDTTNLYTVDLICHGPTFAEVERQFIERIEEKYHSKVTSFSVRYKKEGWTPPYLRAEFQNGKVFEKPFYETDFGYAFKTYSRNACYDCKFKADRHAADITLGDYWGLTKEMEGYHPQGVSVIFVRTDKGQELLSSVDTELFDIRPADTAHALKRNRMFYMSRPKAKDYDQFDRDFKEKGLHYAVCNGPGNRTIKRRTVIRVLRKIIPASVLQTIKKIVR